MAVPTLCLIIQEQGRNQTLFMSRAGWGMFVSVASVLLFPDKARPGLQGQMTGTRPQGLLEVDVDSHPGDSTQAVQESESCFSNRLGAEQPREPQVTKVFFLSGQFKTNRYTSNRLSQTQQEILCESQARRLPHPEHTTSSVHLLTEDRETETADCVQEGPGPLINCGHGQRAEGKGAMISISLQTQVSTHRRPRLLPATRPVQTLSSWPSSSQTLGNSAWGGEAEFACADKSSCLPADLFLCPVSLCYLFLKENTENNIIFYT